MDRIVDGKFEPRNQPYVITDRVKKFMLKKSCPLLALNRIVPIVVSLRLSVSEKDGVCPSMAALTYL